MLRQWQTELREKFNLHWPVYERDRLVWRSPAATGGDREETVGRDDWHRCDAVIASSQLVRRGDRAASLLGGDPWDLIVLDEAHHARRRGAGTQDEDRPNALLALMRELKDRTDGLLLLTATPMQVDPVEVWDLLSLLGMPTEWGAGSFLRFFEELRHPSPSTDAMARNARLFRASEAAFVPAEPDNAAQVRGLSQMQTRKVFDALHEQYATTPSADAGERRAYRSRRG